MFCDGSPMIVGVGIVEPPWKRLGAVEIMPRYQNNCNGASNASKCQEKFELLKSTDTVGNSINIKFEYSLDFYSYPGLKRSFRNLVFVFFVF